MSEHVWVSSAMMDTRINLAVKNDVGERDVQKAIEASDLNTNGKPVPQEHCPTKIWANKDVEDYDRMPADDMPNLFFANSYLVVSERAADVLTKFNLGGGALYPVSEGVFREDKVTRVAGNFYTWIFGNSKSAFIPEQTQSKRPVGISGTRWKLPWKLSDDDIVVSRDVISGPDVWLDDGLWSAIFLSRTLGDELVAAGLEKAFYLYKARVI